MAISEGMNGPQRTACLAKGNTNHKYYCTVPEAVTPCHCEVADKTHTHGQYAILSLAGSQNLCQ